jgi:hypothetical protein
MSGGVAFAASQIGTKNIAADAVTTPKIAPGAVTAKRHADRSVRKWQLQGPVYFTVRGPCRADSRIAGWLITSIGAAQIVRGIQTIADPRRLNSLAANSGRRARIGWNG